MFLLPSDKTHEKHVCSIGGDYTTFVNKTAETIVVACICMYGGK